MGESKDLGLFHSVPFRRRSKQNKVKKVGHRNLGSHFLGDELWDAPEKPNSNLTYLWDDIQGTIQFGNDLGGIILSKLLLKSGKLQSQGWLFRAVSMSKQVL